MPHHHCCVLGCRSDSRYGKREESPSPSKETLRFFCVPSLTSKRALHEEWLKMIGRPELAVSRNTRVCSLHFIDGKPSKENPWPTLNLNVNLPTRRRARKATNRVNGGGDSDETSSDLKRMGKSQTQKEFSRERLFNCLKNGCKNGALNLKIIPSPLSPFQALAKNYHPPKLAPPDNKTESYHYPQIHFSTREANLDSKELAQLESSSLDESESSSRDQIAFSPETIIHEYKQTQTEEENNVYVNFGIDFLKSNEDMMRYYSGFRDYLEFDSFLRELRPALLVSGKFCLDAVENELLLSLSRLKLGLDAQDLAYRSGLSLARVENILGKWEPLLLGLKRKPWI